MVTITYQKELQPATADVIALLPKDGIQTDRRYLDDCRAFARKHGQMAVVTAPYAKDGHIRMAWLLGDTVVEQAACYLPVRYGQYERGSDIAVFDTPLGRVALAVLYDIFQPQVARLCALRGCRLLFCSVGADCDTDEYLVAGPWSVCQANNLPVSVAAARTGQLLLPCALTDDQSGFAPDGRVDFSRLADSYRAFPIFDSLNAAFYERYRGELVP